MDIAKRPPLCSHINRVARVPRFSLKSKIFSNIHLKLIQINSNLENQGINLKLSSLKKYFQMQLLQFDIYLFYNAMYTSISLYLYGILKKSCHLLFSHDHTISSLHTLIHLLQILSLPLHLLFHPFI